MIVNLITEDFIGARFIETRGCPLYKALKRMGYPCARIGGTILNLSDDLINSHSIPDTWHSDLVKELISKADAGEEVNYTIELKEKL